MYKMVGLAEEDRVFTPISRSVRMRLPWTILNLLTATLAASWWPVSKARCRDYRAGDFHARHRRRRRQRCTQTATVIIRAIALGELEFAFCLESDC